MNPLRNIFIAGAAKSGTTALYYLLGQHPQICTPVVKEPNYFSNIDIADDITGPGTGPGDKNTVWTHTKKEYDALFKFPESHSFRMDASVSYLYSRQAARHIAEYSDDAKIIMVLRNPVERAWSHYKHLVRDNREKDSFEAALEKEETRIQKGWEFSWHYRQMGLYSSQIRRYFDHFDRENILIFLYEDLKQNMPHVIQKAANHIGLPDYDYKIDSEKHNVSGVPKSKKLSGLVSRIAGYKAVINKVIPPRYTHRLMQKFRSMNTREGDFTMNKQTKRQLTAYFEKDIKKTAMLTERDLDHWLS